MQQPAVVRIGVRRDEIIVVGRYLYVFRPVIDSILDTIFWGDGYKSVAHIFLLSYLSYHGLCGLRFMFLFTAFHVFMKRGQHAQCSDQEAILLFKATLHDLTTIMRRYTPSLKYIWPLLLIVVITATIAELVIGLNLLLIIDQGIGPCTVLVILICRGLVDPRYTKSYVVTQGGTPSAHSRSESLGPNASPPTAGQAASTKQDQEKDISSSSTAAGANNTNNNNVLLSPALQSMKMSPNDKSVPPLVCCPYRPEATPQAPWDTALAPIPSVPLYMHHVLLLYTRAPQWTDWEVKESTVGRNHPISWTVVKAGLNVAVVRGVSFDDAVRFVNDDIDFAKSVESLHVWQFDKNLGDLRRLHRVDAHTRVIHMIYKQMFFGVAPRDATMYETAMELTPEQIEYYGLCREHANNKNVTDGTGRVFVLASAPAEGVPLVSGHVRCVVHRRAIIIREVPSDNTIELMTIMCGEPGGKVPSRVVDLARGEQMKVVKDMRTALEKYAKKRQ